MDALRSGYYTWLWNPAFNTMCFSGAITHSDRRERVETILLRPFAAATGIAVDCFWSANNKCNHSSYNKRNNVLIHLTEM